MRKTLAVLVLMISALLLLAGPAWAHHLYRIKKVTATTAIDANSFKTLYEVLTDCPRYVEGSSPQQNSTLTITSSSFNPQTVSATWVGTTTAGWQRWRFTGTATTSSTTATNPRSDDENV